MPRTAKQKRKPNMSTTPVPVPLGPTDNSQVRDGHTRLVICRDCGKQVPEYRAVARYCPRCRFFAVAKADYPWSWAAFERAERYERKSCVSVPNATCKPRIGGGIGPLHWLDQTHPPNSDNPSRVVVRPDQPLAGLDDEVFMYDDVIPDSVGGVFYTPYKYEG